MPFARTHSTLADGTFSATGAIAWDANQTPSGADVGGIPYCPTATTETTVAGFTWNVSGAAGEGLKIAAGTATTNVQALSATQTWNAAGVTFTGWKYTITDTASAAGSLAMQILGGASGTTNLLSLGKAGNISGPSDNTLLFLGTTATNAPAGASSAVRGFHIANNAVYGFGNDVYAPSTPVCSLSRISDGLIGVGTGTAASFAGSLKLTTLTLDGLAITKGYTVAALPAGVTGAICHVTDQLTAVAAKGVAPTGGGAVVCVVVYNGAAWVGI